MRVLPEIYYSRGAVLHRAIKVRTKLSGRNSRWIFARYTHDPRDEISYLYFLIEKLFQPWWIRVYSCSSLFLFFFSFSPCSRTISYHEGVYFRGVNLEARWYTRAPRPQRHYFGETARLGGEEWQADIHIHIYIYIYNTYTYIYIYITRSSISICRNVQHLSGRVGFDVWRNRSTFGINSRASRHFDRWERRAK